MAERPEARQPAAAHSHPLAPVPGEEPRRAGVHSPPLGQARERRRELEGVRRRRRAEPQGREEEPHRPGGREEALRCRPGRGRGEAAWRSGARGPWRQTPAMSRPDSQRWREPSPTRRKRQRQASRTGWPRPPGRCLQHRQSPFGSPRTPLDVPSGAHSCPPMSRSQTTPRKDHVGRAGEAK